MMAVIWDALGGLVVAAGLLWTATNWDTQWVSEKVIKPLTTRRRPYRSGHGRHAVALERPKVGRHYSPFFAEPRSYYAAPPGRHRFDATASFLADPRTA
jgi:hypothetical protein